MAEEEDPRRATELSHDLPIYSLYFCTDKAAILAQGLSAPFLVHPRTRSDAVPVSTCNHGTINKPAAGSQGDNAGKVSGMDETCQWPITDSKLLLMLMSNFILTVRWTFEVMAGPGGTFRPANIPESRFTIHGTHWDRGLYRRTGDVLCLLYEGFNVG
jgi:hypothetical protein